jgi:DNA-binding transcriptional MerR regulator
MKRFLGLVVVVSLFATGEAFAQCQQQGSQASAQSTQQVQLLTQQLQQLQNQLVQQQQALALSRPAPAQVSQAAPAQVASRPVAQTISDRLKARGYTQRTDANGKLVWTTPANNPRKLTSSEIASLGLSSRRTPTANVASR